MWRGLRPIIILQIVVTTRGNTEINREPNVRVLALSIRVVAVVITGKHGAMSNAIGLIWHKKCAIGRI